MKYKEELKKYLTNIQGHLEGEYADDTFADGVLFGTSMELSTSNQIGDKIASVILFHQSSIGLMKKLVIRCNFLNKLLIFPSEIKIKKLRDDESYANVYKTLDFNLDFSYKGSLMGKISELNKLRNEVAHKMNEKEVDIFAIDNLKELGNIFEEIWSLYLKAFRDLNERIEVASKKEEIIRLMRNAK